MKYRKKTRTKGDYKREFAGLQLPEHPVNRYKKIFSKKYQRIVRGNSANTPQANKKIDSCCFACLIKNGTVPKGQLPNRIIWEKKADARWLIARWIWDFGFVLPAGLSDYGVGLSPPIDDYIANKSVLFPSPNQPYDLISDGEGKNKLEFEQHNIHMKENLHFAKAKIEQSNFATPSFQGQIGSAYDYLMVGREGNGGFPIFVILFLPTDFPLDGVAAIGDEVGNFRMEGNQLRFNTGTETITLN